MRKVITLLLAMLFVLLTGCATIVEYFSEGDILTEVKNRPTEQETQYVTTESTVATTEEEKTFIVFASNQVHIGEFANFTVNSYTCDLITGDMTLEYSVEVTGTVQDKVEILIGYSNVLIPLTTISKEDAEAGKIIKSSFVLPKQTKDYLSANRAQGLDFYLLNGKAIDTFFCEYLIKETTGKPKAQAIGNYIGWKSLKDGDILAFALEPAYFANTNLSEGSTFVLRIDNQTNQNITVSTGHSFYAGTFIEDFSLVEGLIPAGKSRVFIVELMDFDVSDYTESAEDFIANLTLNLDLYDSNGEYLGMMSCKSITLVEE